MQDGFLILLPIQHSSHKLPKIIIFVVKVVNFTVVYSQSFLAFLSELHVFHVMCPLCIVQFLVVQGYPNIQGNAVSFNIAVPL
jgi:hypothetical protein